MKISIQKTYTEEKEIELPMYLNYGAEAKIISEDEVVYVSLNPLAINYSSRILVEHFIDKGELSTEAAFNNMFQQALSKLNELINKPAEIVGPFEEFDPLFWGADNKINNAHRNHKP